MLRAILPALCLALGLAALLPRPALAQGDVPVELHIIGFDVDDATRQQLEAAAAAGGGQYYASGDATELTEALGQATGLAPPPAQGDPASRPGVTLVLDVSNSMWGQVEGRAKIDIAREAIAQLLTGWDPGADLGLVAYGHRRAGDCADIEALLPPAPLDPAAFLAAVNGLVPTGKTPLTEAVRQAAADLAAQDRPASIILFSDGIETCNADPCALGAELARAGIGLTVHVVGFDVAADESGLACLAESTGGLFLTAADAPQLAQALATVAAAGPASPAGDLVTLVAVDDATGQALTSGVVWTVTSLASEDAVPLSAGVARPALPLAPGEYVAEARAGAAVGRAPFTVAAGTPLTVEVRLGGLGAAAAAGAACAEPNDAFGTPAPVDLAAGAGTVRDAIDPRGDVDFCGVAVPGPGVLTIAAAQAPDPLEIVVRVDDVDRVPVRDWTGELLPGAQPAEADLPEAGRYVLEVADSYGDAAAPDAYELALAFTAAVDETEPNDSLTRPAALALGVPARVAIFPQREHDFLQIEVEEHGELTVEVAEVPPVLDVALRVYGPDGDAVLRDWQTAPAPGVPITLVVDLPEPGRYVVELADSYDDARSPASFAVTARFVPSADAFEPNGSFARAAPLAFDAPAAITILPRGDVDVFVLDAPHRGRLRAVADPVPAALDVTMRLLDADDRVVRDWQAAPAAGVPLAYEVDLPAPGRYVLQLADSYSDARAVEPITLAVSLAVAEDAMEPNDRPRDAKPLPLGAPVQSSILPRGDFDMFVLDAPAAGPLTVRATGVPAALDLALRLLDGNLAVVHDWTVTPAAGLDAEMTVELPAPGRYLLQVSDSYGDASAPEAFTLVATQP